MKVELHCHSNYSDGIPSVKNILRKADTFLDALAITDHNTYDGYHKAKTLEHKVLLIPAVEVHACFGEKVAHTTVLGCDNLKIKKYMDIFELMDMARSNGGVIINVHPFGGLFRPGFTEDEIVRKFDAVEVINGMTFGMFNKKALEMARKLNMNMVAGSDAHTMNLVGEYACEIKTVHNDVEGIIKAIKKGDVELPQKKTQPTRIFASQISRKFYTKTKLHRRSM